MYDKVYSVLLKSHQTFKVTETYITTSHVTIVYCNLVMGK